MITKFKIANTLLKDLEYKLYDTANQFNRKKFEKTCLKNIKNNIIYYQKKLL